MVYAKSVDGSLMLLGYYRNSLGRVFAYEGFLSCCLFMSLNAPITITELKANYKYLSDLLRMEYLVSPISIEDALESLRNKGVIIETSGEVISIRKEVKSSYWITFLGSFIWPLIECYWTCALYFNSFILGKKITYTMLCHKVIYFLILDSMVWKEII